MSVIEQMMKDRAAWVSNRDKENKEKTDRARRRLHRPIACAGIVAAAGIILFCNYSVVVNGFSKLMGKCL